MAVSVLRFVDQADCAKGLTLISKSPDNLKGMLLTIPGMYWGLVPPSSCEVVPKESDMNAWEILEKRFPGIVSENIPRDKLVPKRGTLSNQKAKTLLGFASKYPIDIGYNLYIDWYLNFIDKHKIKLSNYSQSNE